MVFGYELTSLEPDTEQLVNCPSSGVAEVFVNLAGLFKGGLN